MSEDQIIHDTAIGLAARCFSGELADDPSVFYGESGRRLQALRRARGITIYKLARALGWSYAKVVNIEAGIGNQSASDVVDFCEALCRIEKN